MPRALAKLLLLLAVLLMPVGMAQAPAAAPHHAIPSAEMPMQHCPEQTPTHQSKAGMAECTMSCSAALPADDCRSAEPPRIVSTAPPPVIAPELHGILLETATPPPRLS
jgi:hypothetical protein